MLDVTFSRDDRNRPASIAALGHAEFAAYGEDVVCAAVSAILQAARLGLERHAHVDVRAHQQSGSLRLEWPVAARDDAAVQAIVATAELSVEQIAAQFPDHVRFHREP